jgi:hypothetical protein
MALHLVCSAYGFLRESLTKLAAMSRGRPELRFRATAP